MSRMHSPVKAAKDAIRGVLYHSGVWPAWHRWRNRRRLTVFMFHRVLPPLGAAWERAEREFTFSTEGFERCLDFIRRHYAVVDLRALETPEALPPCPALITFDDGWRDTLQHAAPALKQRGLPATVFVVPTAVEDGADRWWSDALVEALADPARAAPVVAALGCDAADTRACHAAAARYPDLRRAAGLATTSPDGQRQMLREAELPALLDHGLAIGAHGHSHAPLTHVHDAARELSLSRAWLDGRGRPPPAMAFPHGAWSAELADAARAAGFRFVFTSEAGLVPLPGSSRAEWPLALARVHLAENEWTQHRGVISGPKLAAYLFFRRSVP